MSTASLLLLAASLVQDPTPSAGTIVEKLDPRIWCIHEARDGAMWFGSNGAGVYRYDGAQLTQFTTADGLVGEQVRSIDEDSQGRILVGTYAGVALFDGKSWSQLEVEELPAGEGWKLQATDVWIAYAPGTGGPCRWDGQRLTRLKLGVNQAAQTRPDWEPARSESAHGVYTVHRDRRGHVWFGTAGAGLCRFDGESLQWMYEERLTTMPRGGSFGIRSIYQDRNDHYWICNTRQRFEIAQESGPLRYEKQLGLPKAEQDDSPNFNYFPSIAEDADGALWMACGSDGVWKFDGESVKKYAVGDEAYVMRLVHDRNGKIWAGTIQQGVFLLTQDSSTSFESFGD